jgi:hypothetical protein
MEIAIVDLRATCCLHERAVALGSLGSSALYFMHYGRCLGEVRLANAREKTTEKESLIHAPEKEHRTMEDNSGV